MTVKRWSKEDEFFLMNSYLKLSNNELANYFGVSKIAVQRKLARLKLIRQYQKKWSEREEKFLLENYAAMSDGELAEVFNVTRIAVKRKLARLGCRRNLRQKRQNGEVKLKINKSGESKVTPGLQNSRPNFLITKPSASVSVKKADAASNDSPSKPPKTLKTITRQIPQAAAKRFEPRRQAFTASAAAQPEAVPAAIQAPAGVEKQYCCSKSYEIGELIYHSTWNDSGRVTKLIKTSGGHKAIVVEFNRGGQKILLCEVCKTDTA